MKNIKIKLLVLIILCVGSSISLQCREKNQLLEIAIGKVIKAFEKQDYTTLNKMINEDIGIYVIHRNGVFDTYNKLDKVDFNSSSDGFNFFDYSYFEFESSYPIKYEELPVFSCDTEVWSKSGLFCNMEMKDHLLSKTAKNLKQYVYANISARTILKFKKLEKQSLRIVLCNEKGESLIFYLTKIKNNWYLTILDKVSADCSA